MASKVGCCDLRDIYVLYELAMLLVAAWHFLSTGTKWRLYKNCTKSAQRDTILVPVPAVLFSTRLVPLVRLSFLES